MSLSLFKVHLYSLSLTSYIPSVIKKPLYWFYWTLIHHTTLLWSSWVLSYDPGSLCAHVHVILDLRGLYGGLHTPTQTEEEKKWEKLTLWASYHQPLGINIRSNTKGWVPQALQYFWRHMDNDPCTCLIYSWCRCFIQINPGHTNPRINRMLSFFTFLSFSNAHGSQWIMCCFAEDAWQLWVCCMIHLN